MALATQTPTPKLGIIGGTGIDCLEGFELRDRIQPETPFGPISGSVLLGTLHGVEVALINRHGLLKDEQGDHIPPHAVNYRANLWLLKQLSVERVLALNAVGGISEHWPPGRLGVPDDLIDYSYGRKHSFFDPDSPIGYHHHVEMGQPFSAAMNNAVAESAAQAGLIFQNGGVLAVTQGPRLETAAEVARLERDGCDLVGMTSMPEAALAAELALEYTSVAFSVNWAAGKAPDSSKGIHDEIVTTIASCQKQINQLLAVYVATL